MFLLSFIFRWLNTGDAGEMVGDDRAIVPSIPAGVSGTALAASLLRDGWTVSCILVYVFQLSCIIAQYRSCKLFYILFFIIVVYRPFSFILLHLF